MEIFKRYEYWGSEDGKPVKKFTKWFTYNSDYCPKWQLEGKLKNEYRR